ncbi:MAG TPA: hypothetical protein VM869_00685 [Enhygromyxa sp.]|nr:hypothetical protein [Enhygromyxa sp.]
MSLEATLLRVSLLLLVAITACTKPADPADEQPRSEAAVVEPAPAPEPAPAITPPSDPQPEPPPLEHFSEDLAIAWYDASRPEHGLILLCDSFARWIGDPLDAGPCVPEGSTLQVLDTHGVATWTTRRGQHLEREGAQLPDQSMALLVAKDHAFPPDAKLERRDLRQPSKPTKRAAPAVREWLVAHDEHGYVDDGRVVAFAELRGEFGRADRIGVFELEFEEDVDAVHGWQVLAALDPAGELVGVYDAKSALAPGGYAVAGVSDIDGDGVEEAIWWMVAEGLGIGLQLTHERDGQHRLAQLMGCECGADFRLAYDRKRKLAPAQN